jgi:hypothetical protein
MPETRGGRRQKRRLPQRAQKTQRTAEARPKTHVRPMELGEHGAPQ